MDGQTTCPYCRAPIQETDFFCPNCGKQLKEKQLSTSVSKQAIVYIVSALLPPFGLWWAFKYIRQGSGVSKKIGIAVVVITVISLVLNVWGAVAVYNFYLQQLNAYTGGLF